MGNQHSAAVTKERSTLRLPIHCVEMHVVIVRALFFVASCPCNRQSTYPGRTRSDNLTCCLNQTCCLTQSPLTDTGPTTPNSDLVRYSRGRYHGDRRPSSDDSFHSPTVIPPSALDKPSILKRYHRRRTTR